MPLFIAVVHLQYLWELDLFPNERATLQAIVSWAMPIDGTAPPLMVNIPSSILEAMKVIHPVQAIKILEDRFNAEITRNRPCNDS